MSDVEELDSLCVIRPERFILPEVNGLAIPVLTIDGGTVAGRWRLYLRWTDGKREVRELPKYLELPTGRVWFTHDPASPDRSTVQALGGWSAASRKAWLEGTVAPNPAQLFEELTEIYARYLHLPGVNGLGAISALALWSMLSYNYQAWDAVPYLFVSGPAGSGKSRAFDVLSRTSFRPLSSSNLTGPALFRTLHDRGGCVLYDEAERLRQSQDPGIAEINSMLLAGYRRGGQATRLESVGDRFRTVAFDVYGPKALGAIASLPAALSTRCIHVAMFRAPPNSPVPRRRLDDAPWEALRDRLHVLTLEYGPTWLKLSRQTDACPEMSGRNAELWQPLLALAAWIDTFDEGGRHAIVQDHALSTIADSGEDGIPETDEILLTSLANAWRSRDWPSPADLLSQAQEKDPASFQRWSARTVSNRLKAYGIPATRKSCGRREYRDVTQADLLKVQTAYGVDLGITSADPPPTP